MEKRQTSQCSLYVVNCNAECSVDIRKGFVKEVVVRLIGQFVIWAFSLAYKTANILQSPTRIYLIFFSFLMRSGLEEWREL